MSQGQRIPLPQAEALATELVELLRPECERIRIAGSIRRRRSHVADIEIVAIPRRAPSELALFADLAEPVDLLNARINALRREGRLALRAVEIHRADGSIDEGRRDGTSYKALEYSGFPVDMFITDVDRWGVIFALRTGPGDWNQRLVEECKRYNRRVEGGRVLHLGRPLPTLTEEAFFAAVGQPWLDPVDRTVDRVHIVSPALLEAAVT